MSYRPTTCAGANAGWLTPGQAATVFGVSERTVRAWIEHGVSSRAGDRVYLPARKVGGRWRIPATVTEFPPAN